MSFRFTAFMVIPAVLAAGVLALQAADGGSSETATRPRAMSAQLAPAGELLPVEHGEMLPPNHPSIGSTSPHEPAPAVAGDTPAIVWKAPGAWEEAPNPNTMRLATYRAPGGVEISVSRAGGASEANILRWTEQFDDVSKEGRAERTVHGLHVVVVDVTGTYAGGDMGGGAPGESSEPKRGWVLVGAIVESRSPSYFFKMTGPATAVRAARPAFERLVDGIAPM
jgi:hypothetical protein